MAGTSQAVGLLGEMIGTTLKMAFWLFVIPFCVFLFSWHFDRMTARVMLLIPVIHRDRACRIAHRMDEAISELFSRAPVHRSAVGVMYAIGWALTDVPLRRVS